MLGARAPQVKKSQNAGNSECIQVPSVHKVLHTKKTTQLVVVVVRSRAWLAVTCHVDGAK